MTISVTMLQTRMGEDGNLWTVAGSPYDASLDFAYYLIGNNFATGTLPTAMQSYPMTQVVATAAEIAAMTGQPGVRYVERDGSQREFRWVNGAMQEIASASGFTVASQAEAEAGSNNTKGMTPLRTSQFLDIRKGAANGVATLGGDGKVPSSQLPEALGGGLSYQGVWNAATNTPTMPSAVGNSGEYYKVSVSGATEIDGIDSWGAGDWIISNGTTWDKITNTESVSSVNSQTGAVVLGKGDVGLGNADNTADASKPVSTAQQTALNLKADLASPSLTGTPTAPTATFGTNTTQIATTAFVATAVSAATGGGLSGYWHDRPRAEDVPVGTVYMATDWNNSLWFSDGYAHWKPVGGQQVVKVLAPRNLYSRGTRFDAYPTEYNEKLYDVGMVLDDFECEVVMRHRCFWTRKPNTETFRFYDALDLRSQDETSGVIAPMLIYATASPHVMNADGRNTVDRPMLFIDKAVLKGVGPGAALTQSNFERTLLEPGFWGDLTGAPYQPTVWRNFCTNLMNRRLVAPNFVYRQVIDNSGNYANSLQIAQRIVDSLIVTVRQG